MTFEAVTPMHHLMTMGSSLPPAAEVPLAVVATLTKGYDLDYIWKQVDQGPAKDAAAITSKQARPAESRPADGGAPAHRTSASRVGQLIEREPYDLLFGEHKAPDGTQLGRAPGGGRKAAEIYAELLAAEPHAIAERKRELRLDAARQARQSPLFFDLTLSLSKSISIFHASLGENARLAREAGDTAGDEYWSGLVAEVDAMIWQAVHAGFELLPAGGRLHPHRLAQQAGQRPGDRPVARGGPGGRALAAAHLPRRRHAAARPLADRPRRPHGIDGKWRAPDSLGYNEHIGAVAAITAQHLEEALTARFGLEWVARDDGHGFEIRASPGR